MFNKIKKIKNLFLDLLFPIECLSCGKEGYFLCPDCLEKIPFVDKFTCPVCGKPSLYGQTHQICRRKTSLDGLVYATSYKNETINKAIKQFKYNSIKNLGKPLARLMIKFIENSGLKNFFAKNNFILIPIPLFFLKQKNRGFNQSEVLADEIANYFNWPIEKDLLKRTKPTRSQTELTKGQRSKNVLNAFKVKNKIGLLNKNIILVDDVFTTGATLNEAAKVLKESGVNKVWGLTLAKD
ncbi:ComF family protein [bacterium]|nr:ComF family protein [bacterium]